MQVLIRIKMPPKAKRAALNLLILPEKDSLEHKNNHPKFQLHSLELHFRK
uniref:Uncharacterized protein MANES_10G072600 n=1 Tax=Rhizophora mucronata TaxID=61149 RepID=A0A2P2JIY7_RHIMU